ncbi:hypothetical protein DL767_002632 [Monosporascus sp. MG133]|nr:hypothetical protein DL767_002632 [Monosporascus sp. MG133]
MSPNHPGLLATASLQLSSAFFGKPPLEVREMIYSEFWVVFGLNQHVFSHDGRLTHCPCVHVPGEEDWRNNEFEEAWQNRRRSRAGSLVIDDKWSSRISSTWNNRWRGEEEMVSDPARRRGTLFLPALLTCKRIAEPRPLGGALQDALEPRALRLPAWGYPQTGPRRHRNWWEVRERWVLSAVRGMLARGLTVQLPEVTVGLEWLKPYQYVEVDKTPFKLERYRRLQWVGTDEGHVVSRLEFLRPIERWDVVRESRLQKAKRGLKDLLFGLKGV